jgi:hypothetical protein
MGNYTLQRDENIRFFVTFPLHNSYLSVTFFRYPCLVTYRGGMTDVEQRKVECKSVWKVFAMTLIAVSGGMGRSSRASQFNWSIKNNIEIHK